VRDLPLPEKGRSEMFRLLLLLLSVFGPLFAGPAVSAQQDRPRVPVLLAIVDTLPDTQPRFRIVQLADTSAPYVVLLPRDASPELLSEAVVALRLVWATSGSETRSAVFRTAAPASTQTRPRRVLPWGNRVLQDLRAARARQIPGIGHVRAVRIWLARRTHDGGVTP
jgi:hypothetical protein